VFVSYNIDIAVIIAPYFNYSNSPDGISKYFEDIAAKARVPILLYNIPQCVGESIPEEVVTKLARQFQFIGLKDSGGDLTHPSSLLNEIMMTFIFFKPTTGY
jgi:4-hydroxy-tetrahydrodipicolinate synthase